MDLVLHIGTGKAGSTSLQFFLRDNRDRLAELGVLYPSSPGRARHGKLSLFIRDGDELVATPHWQRQRQSDPRIFRRRFRRRLLAEIEDSGLDRVLLSDEEIYKSSDAALTRLRRFTDQVARRVRVVVYLRRQDEHMVSRYQQGVKIGWTTRLADWANEDMSDLYDYASRLRKHRKILGPDPLVVRRLDPACLLRGSLFEDFLEAAGIEATGVPLTSVTHRNVSLDAESVEFLRILNLYRVEHEGAIPGLIDNRSVASRLGSSSTGPTLSLPPRQLDAFMEQWEESNRVVAREFVGDRSGPLFPTPRKDGGSVMEQSLDPARVDHLCEVAELPDGLRPELRRLAEREARRG
ncbi:hypothetical protein [Nocardioides coralli]|uniref:hypothetical protein n=1 Tax=Nocardioides coralli TaxID=2872154 RepID=UPI001CA3B278|nr:hypothetical protein [Nocardioides coralli]QZY28152.1 hypothetical protein K6T13_11720 [Nocardioides coralli]